MEGELLYAAKGQRRLLRGARPIDGTQGVGCTGDKRHRAAGAGDVHRCCNLYARNLHGDYF